MKNQKVTVGEKDIIISGWNFLYLALYAFGGLGVEVILAFVIEPAIYGVSMNEWATPQNISHWVITCALWGLIGYTIIKIAKKRYKFNLFQSPLKMKTWQRILVFVCVVFSLFLSYIDWNGSKIVKEFAYNGWLKFIFQYIYYLFEASLFMLIIVFSQQAFEIWFENDRIPYGGITVALTWGLSHIFTQGSLTAGLLTSLSGLMYGIVYLLVNKDVRKAYLILLIMFVF